MRCFKQLDGRGARKDRDSQTKFTLKTWVGGRCSDSNNLEKTSPFMSGGRKNLRKLKNDGKFQRHLPGSRWGPLKNLGRVVMGAGRIY